MFVGGNLEEVLRRPERVPEATIKKWLIQLTQGLAYLHQNQVLHCDLELRNVLLDRNHDIKLSNFGMSTVLNKPTASMSYSSSSMYLSPEIRSRGAYTQQTDMWALGRLLHSLCTHQAMY